MSSFHIDPEFQPLAREIGLDADAIFTHELIKPWRVLNDRENCTLDYDAMDGSHVRWHVKRFPASNGKAADAEVQGVRLLNDAQIPTIRLVGWGKDNAGRAFVISQDLEGFRDSEKLVLDGLDFLDLLPESAALVAKLHNAGLHHRDLYLCHIFSRVRPSTTHMRLIDVTRVKKLPWLFRRRWIVKDLAQFHFSLTKLSVDEFLRGKWMFEYCKARGIRHGKWLYGSVIRKANWIAKHDAKLRKDQPTRNISIPQ